MAMNKKEMAALEDALITSALRSTSEVVADMPPPASYNESIISGYMPLAPNTDSARVEEAWSRTTSHGIGKRNPDNSYTSGSQGCRSLYSTRMLALRALRYQVEQDCARRLRRIDKMIEAEKETE